MKQEKETTPAYPISVSGLGILPPKVRVHRWIVRADGYPWTGLTPS